MFFLAAAGRNGGLPKTCRAVAIRSMKSSLLALALCPALLTGCASIEPFEIRVSGNRTHFDLVNVSGQDLHKIKVQLWIFDGWKNYVGTHKEAIVADGDTLPGNVAFNHRIETIEIFGWCKEGRIRQSWDYGATPLARDVESPEDAKREAEIWRRLMTQP
jgi:hypothetical protein